MKDRPILFSAAMVRAILANTKTQTRRALLVQPKQNASGSLVWGSRASMGLDDRGDHWHCSWDADHQRRACTREAYGWGAGSGCPYGVPGDRLWVREAWRADVAHDAIPPRDIPPGPYFCEASRATWEGGPHEVAPGKLRPGMFMPRWASRITLEVTAVRVEQLQGISESDCWAEGIEVVDGMFDAEIPSMAKRIPGKGIEDAVPTYACLWESINGPGSWDANPWVWCVSFRRRIG